jgi:hypothetical protein
MALRKLRYSKENVGPAFTNVKLNGTTADVSKQVLKGKMFTKVQAICFQATR